MTNQIREVLKNMLTRTMEESKASTTNISVKQKMNGKLEKNTYGTLSKFLGGASKLSLWDVLANCCKENLNTFWRYVFSRKTTLIPRITVGT